MPEMEMKNLVGWLSIECTIFLIPEIFTYQDIVKNDLLLKNEAKPIFMPLPLKPGLL